jgi:hypothetical protein
MKAQIICIGYKDFVSRFEYNIQIKTVSRVWIGDQFGHKTKNGGAVVKCLAV